MNVIITGSDSQISKSLQKINLLKKNNFFFFNKSELNILNYNSLLSVFDKIKPDMIINCVAYTDVIAAENNKLINYFNYQIENWQTSIITLLSNHIKK